MVGDAGVGGVVEGVVGGAVVGGYVAGAVLGRGLGTVVRRGRRRGWPHVEVALKSPVAGDPHTAAGLRREADLLARSDHPNLVRLLDVVDHHDGPSLVLPLAPEGSLATRVHRHGPLPPAAAVDLLLDVAAAVASLQAQGLVHGDVKPANVLLTRDGRPVVGDLGSTVPCGEPVRGGGSGRFAPPELVPGVAAAVPQDVYGLGATTLAVLGGPPGAGTGAAHDLGVSRRLATLLEAALAHDPAERHPSAAAFWSALAGCPEAARLAGGRLGPF